MSDTRAVMREFRFLDEKRKLGSLSPTEETRWHELRAQLGAPEAPPPAVANPYAAYPQGYWGQDGQWYAYPAAYPPGAYAPAQDPQAAYAAAYAQQAYAQQQYAAAYDPNAAYAQPAYDPNAGGYDPNAAAYDPNAGGYDPNAASYDPNAAAYDPQAYAAYAAQYGQPAYAPYPAQGYDPAAYGYAQPQPGHAPTPYGYDPNAAYAQQQQLAQHAYDPAQGYADPAAYGTDPNAYAAYADPSAQQAYAPEGSEPQPAADEFELPTYSAPLQLTQESAAVADSPVAPEVVAAELPVEEVYEISEGDVQPAEAESAAPLEAAPEPFAEPEAPVAALEPQAAVEHAAPELEAQAFESEDAEPGAAPAPDDVADGAGWSAPELEADAPAEAHAPQASADWSAPESESIELAPEQIATLEAAPAEEQLPTGSAELSLEASWDARASEPVAMDAVESAAQAEVPATELAPNEAWDSAVAEAPTAELAPSESWAAAAVAQAPSEAEQSAATEPVLHPDVALVGAEPLEGEAVGAESENTEPAALAPSEPVLDAAPEAFAPEAEPVSFIAEETASALAEDVPLEPGTAHVFEPVGSAEAVTAPGLEPVTTDAAEHVADELPAEPIELEDLAASSAEPAASLPAEESTFELTEDAPTAPEAPLALDEDVDLGEPAAELALQQGSEPATPAFEFPVGQEPFAAADGLELTPVEPEALSAAPEPTLALSDTELSIEEAPAETASASESAFEVVDAPPEAFASAVSALELRPVRVAPDLQAQTVGLADESTAPGMPANEESFDLSGQPEDAVPLASAGEFVGYGDSVAAPADAAQGFGVGDVQSGALADLVSAPEPQPTENALELPPVESIWSDAPAEAQGAWDAQAQWQPPVAETSTQGWDAAAEAVPAAAEESWSAAAPEAPVAETVPAEPLYTAGWNEPAAAPSDELVLPVPEAVEVSSEWASPAQDGAESLPVEVAEEWSDPSAPAVQPAEESAAAAAIALPASDSSAEAAPEAPVADSWETTGAAPQWSAPEAEQPAAAEASSWEATETPAEPDALPMLEVMEAEVIEDAVPLEEPASVEAAAPPAAEGGWDAAAQESDSVAAVEPAQPATDWSAPAAEAAPLEPSAGGWDVPMVEEAPAEAQASEWSSAPVEVSEPESSAPQWEGAAEEAAALEVPATEWSAPAVESSEPAAAAETWAAPEEAPLYAAAGGEAQPSFEVATDWSSAEPAPLTPETDAAASWQVPAPAWGAAPEGGWDAEPATPEWSAAPAAVETAAPAEAAWGEVPAAAPASEWAPESAEASASEWAAPEAAGSDAADAWSAAPTAEDAPAWGAAPEAAWQSEAPAEAPQAAVEEPVLEPELEEIELVEEAVEAPAHVAPVVEQPSPPAWTSSPLPSAAVALQAAANSAADYAAPEPTPAPNGLAPSSASSAPEHEVPLFDIPDAVLGMPDALTPLSFVPGEHRVIVHTVEGQVKRGTIRDVDLLDEIVALEQQTGFAPERIPTRRMKAIFFMLPTGSRQPSAAGQKVRVTFTDGRQVAGFSTDHKASGNGFFITPADNRTNTARIFIYRSSVHAVAEG